jgi:hypothetical protein
MLNWSTYQSLPVLRSYAAALKHFETVKPIRGDADGTKPVGRRDQKWLSIYKRETDNAVCIGTPWHRGQHKSLLAYHPDGRVAIEQSISAACRERLLRIAGLNIQRYNNEDWVHAISHVDGEEVVGQYPLQLHHNNQRKAVFILRENDTPIYLNPVPVFKHTINRQEKAKLTKQYQPFMQYVEAMAKLSADPTQFSQWSKESMDNPRLPAITREERSELGVPPNTLYYRYGKNDETLAEFLTLVESGDTENWYKAMAWLSNGYWRVLLSDARQHFTHIVHYMHRDALFAKVRVDAGVAVRDRYAQYFRWG